MQDYSSEALKKGIKPDKDIKDMTSEEIKTFQDSINPDEMGFDGHEGMVMPNVSD